jgi:hypothetical protein
MRKRVSLCHATVLFHDMDSYEFVLSSYKFVAYAVRFLMRNGCFGNILAPDFNI